MGVHNMPSIEELNDSAVENAVDAFDELMHLRSELPEATWLVSLTKEQMRDMIAVRYIERADDPRALNPGLLHQLEYICDK